MGGSPIRDARRAFDVRDEIVTWSVNGCSKWT
jgi:hypothetical protein